MINYGLCAYVAESSKVLPTIKEEVGSENLIVVREAITDGIALKDSFNLKKLRESVDGVNGNTRSYLIGLPSLTRDQVQQKTYVFTDRGIFVPFVTFRNKTTLEGEGFLIYGETNTHLEAVMQAYNLPVPENFR